MLPVKTLLAKGTRRRRGRQQQYPAGGEEAIKQVCGREVSPACLLCDAERNSPSCLPVAHSRPGKPAAGKDTTHMAVGRVEDLPAPSARQVAYGAEARE